MNIGNVIGLFDGMSCLQIALNRMGVTYDNYFASEIDKYAIKVTQSNYINTIQLGDIKGVKSSILPKINLLAGGSPCQGFSFAGKGLNFDDPRSKLFFEFVRLKNELKPQYWILENVKMKKEHELAINKILGCKPYRLNSSLVSAQNRQRLYWTNIKINRLPFDKKIFLKDIIQPIDEIAQRYFIKNAKVDISKITSIFQKNRTLRIGGRGSLSNKHHFDVIKLSKKLDLKSNQSKASCLTAGGNSGGNHSDMDILCVASRGRNIVNGKRKDFLGAPTIQRLEPNLLGKTNCLTTVLKDNWLAIQNENFSLRRLTEIEFERLQTVPDNYTNFVSPTQRYKMLGNGWTVDVICFILSFVYSA